MKEGQILHRYFNYLSLLNDIELSPLDPTGYDIISFRDDLYHFANGHCNFIDTLSKKFPQNRKDIENYVDTLHKITYNSPYYSFKDFDNINLIDPEHVKISVNNYLDGISNNETLNNILAGNSPLYAGVKNKTPLYIHALISDFYINSAYRIVNSSDTIAKSLIISLKKMGADLYNNATVNKIICDDEKAVAIRLNNGELIDSKYIISDIHPETLLDMIDSHLIRKAYRQRICNMQQTVSTFTVYIKFKDNTVPYLNSNFSNIGAEMFGIAKHTVTTSGQKIIYTCTSVMKKSEMGKRSYIICIYEILRCITMARHYCRQTRYRIRNVQNN